MATLIPTSQAATTGVEAYEDMFKEITRKLYGDETGHGLHTLGTPIAHVATSGPTAPEGGERSFTTLMTDRSLIEYEHNGSEPNNQFKAEDHLTTAFNLAALMQNGFPPPGTILNPHTFTTNAGATKLNTTISTATDDNRWQAGGNNGQTNEDCLPWNTNKLLPNYTPQQKPFKPKREVVVPDASSPTNSNNSNNQIDQKSNIVIIPNGSGNGVSSNNNATNSTNNTNNTGNLNLSNNSGAANSNQQQVTQITKRYNCSNCPYSTDRRDLFTRHENIHKDEKPFHCYVCTKQFNRADHVKKHFLRMHREMAYDINKTRRTPSSSSNNGANATIKTKVELNPIVTASSGASTIATTSFFNNQNNMGGQAQNNSTITIPSAFQSNNSTTSSGHGVINAAGGNGLLGNSTNPESNNNQQTTMIPNHQIKIEKTEKTPKKKGEKRFVCCYCPWSGADSWGLKRHLNTHTKPYVCLLCDYKAARSERLATHVFKVHNKKACNKCNFLADDQVQFLQHQSEAHPHDSRPPRSSGGNNNSNVLRTIGNSFIQNNQLNNLQNTSTTTTFGQNNTQTPNAGGNNLSNNGGTSNLYSNSSTILADVANNHQNWSNRSSASQKRGAERLFQYMEADGSDPEDYSRQMQMVALSRNTASVAQDFHNAGGGYKKINISQIKNNNNNNNNSLIKTEKFIQSHLISNNYQEQEKQQPITTEIIGQQMNSNLYQHKIVEGAAATPAAYIISTTQNLQQQQHPTANLINNNYNTNSSPALLLTNNNNFSSNNNLTPQQQLEPATTTTIPTTNITVNNKKRRRQSHDKENKSNFDLKLKHLSQMQQQQLQQQSNLDLAGIERHMKDAITRFYMDPFGTIQSQTTSEKSPTTSPAKTKFSFDNLSSIHDYLKNNKELTISIEEPQPGKCDRSSSSSNCGGGGCVAEKRNRKQAQPRKIEKFDEDDIIDLEYEPEENATIKKESNVIAIDQSPIVTNIRDKHLIRLVSRKKFCKICKNTKGSPLIMPYHSKTSLILHMKWRHSKMKHRCRPCKLRFCHKYKLNLHQKLKH